MGWEKEGFLEEVSVAKSWQIEAMGLVLELRGAGTQPTGQVLCALCTLSAKTLLRVASEAPASGSSRPRPSTAEAVPAPGRYSRAFICIISPAPCRPSCLRPSSSQGSSPPPAGHSSIAAQCHPFRPAPPVGHRGRAARSPEVSEKQFFQPGT